jgi:hypothetical protein
LAEKKQQDKMTIWQQIRAEEKRKMDFEKWTLSRRTRWSNIIAEENQVMLIDPSWMRDKTREWWEIVRGFCDQECLGSMWWEVVLRLAVVVTQVLLDSWDIWFLLIWKFDCYLFYQRTCFWIQNYCKFNIEMFRIWGVLSNAEYWKLLLTLSKLKMKLLSKCIGYCYSRSRIFSLQYKLCGICSGRMWAIVQKWSAVYSKLLSRYAFMLGLLELLMLLC